MKCLNPKFVNGFYIPCGKCARCLKRSQNDLMQRLYYEQFRHKFVSVLFLSYDDFHLPSGELVQFKDHPSVSKAEIQLFLKRLRINLKRHGIYDKKLTYYICSEYGEKHGRPHYHGILYFDSYVDFYKVANEVWNSWSRGYTKLERPRGNGCFSYVSKYVTKLQLVPEGCEKPFRLWSKGLGSNFVEDMAAWCQAGNRYFPLRNQKYGLCRYYVGKIFPNPFEKDDYFEISYKIYRQSLLRTFHSDKVITEKSLCKALGVENLFSFACTKIHSNAWKLDKMLRSEQNQIEHLEFVEQNMKDFNVSDISSYENYIKNLQKIELEQLIKKTFKFV